MALKGLLHGQLVLSELQACKNKYFKVKYLRKKKKKCIYLAQLKSTLNFCKI